MGFINFSGWFDFIFTRIKTQDSADVVKTPQPVSRQLSPAESALLATEEALQREKTEQARQEQRLRRKQQMAELDHAMEGCPVRDVKRTAMLGTIRKPKPVQP